MNAIMNKTNTGKLLVAVLAMAMVIAGAVVVLSDNNEVNAATPDKDPFEGMYSGNGASYANGVFTVNDYGFLDVKCGIESDSGQECDFLTICRGCISCL